MCESCSFARYLSRNHSNVWRQRGGGFMRSLQVKVKCSIIAIASSPSCSRSRSPLKNPCDHITLFERYHVHHFLYKLTSLFIAQQIHSGLLYNLQAQSKNFKEKLIVCNQKQSRAVLFLNVNCFRSTIKLADLNLTAQQNLREQD